MSFKAPLVALLARIHVGIAWLFFVHGNGWRCNLGRIHHSTDLKWQTLGSQKVVDGDEYLICKIFVLPGYGETTGCWTRQASTQALQVAQTRGKSGCQRKLPPWQGLIGWTTVALSGCAEWSWKEMTGNHSLLAVSSGQSAQSNHPREPLVPSFPDITAYESSWAGDQGVKWFLNAIYLIATLGFCHYIS